MKIVLLTGANGFIGRHCIRPLLSNGSEVHAVDIRIPNEKTEDVKWHQVDLLDSEQVLKLIANVKPTHLLHCAWFTEPSTYLTSLENIRWVQASLDLLQAFSQHGGQRLVMAGTCAEYDWRYGYCSEMFTPLAPASLYGICKHSLQLMLTAFSKQSGLSAAWGRVFFLYGPHEHPDRLVSSVINSLLLDKPARCSYGGQIRDFLFVEDVASAFVALLGSDASGPVNIASGIPITLKDIIYKIAEKINRRDLIQLGTLPTPGNEPPLLVAGVSRLCNEVGWKAKYNLDEGLDQTIKWWEKQLSLN